MKRKNFRLYLGGLFLVSLMLCYSSIGLAVDYPKRPITLVINFAAGGTTDTAARIIARKVEKEIGQPIVCKNATGASGTIGVATVVRAKPDGYTIGTCNMPAVAIVPHLRKVPYKFEDVIQIGVILPYEYGISVRADAPWDTWEEFVDYVKKNPGTVTYGTVGTGTTDHLTCVRIAEYEGMDWIHVPFKGVPYSLSALLGGHITAINCTFVAILSSIRAGKVKPLLITSKNRIPVVPDVPTMSEKGYPFYQASYCSIIAPKGISESTRKSLEEAFKKAVQSPEIQEELRKKYSLNPQWISGEEYTKILRELSNDWKQVLEKIGLIK